MRSSKYTVPDQFCQWISQDGFFCHLVGPVVPTGIANVHWVRCINAIKLIYTFNEEDNVWGFDDLSRGYVTLRRPLGESCILEFDGFKPITTNV